MRYNYVLAAALDAGVAFGSLLVFLCLFLPKGGIVFNWWGNTVWETTNDAMAAPWQVVAPNTTFGPTSWS